jgi:hypothetical protein
VFAEMLHSRVLASLFAGQSHKRWTKESQQWLLFSSKGIVWLATDSYKTTGSSLIALYQLLIRHYCMAHIILLDNKHTRNVHSCGYSDYNVYMHAQVQ